jgi:hypothetical protein
MLRLLPCLLLMLSLDAWTSPVPVPESVKKNFRQTFQSCALITSEHLTTLQLRQRGIALEAALRELPGLSDAGKKRVEYIYRMVEDLGILNAYADINTNFTRCAKLVYDVRGKPEPETVEYGYYFCAGENRIRFELMLMLDAGKATAEILQSIPDSHFHLLGQYQKLIHTKGMLAAFDFTANNLKGCLKNLESNLNP